LATKSDIFQANYHTTTSYYFLLLLPMPFSEYKISTLFCLTLFTPSILFKKSFPVEFVVYADAP
jgi:hypothetical protein